MDYTILEEPKYTNKVVVIIEGQNEDGDYLSMEREFTKAEFDSHVAADLKKVLTGYYHKDIALHELSNESIDIRDSDLSSCKHINGFEVMYFDNNGICYDVSMKY